MTIELIKEGGLIIVPVAIYSHKSDIKASFVLDTGAFKTIIDYTILQMIEYKQSDYGKKVYTNTAGGRSSGRLIKIKSFGSLGIIRRNFEVLGKDLSPNLMIDGLLGLDFIKNHILEIDLKNNYLKFN